MLTKFSRCVVLLVALCLPLATFADVAAGNAAFKRGDYQAALKAFEQAAKKGDIMAQYNLGLMHDLGHGIPRNAKLAARWFRRAADQNYDGAEKAANEVLSAMNAGQKKRATQRSVIDQ